MRLAAALACTVFVASACGAERSQSGAADEAQTAPTSSTSEPLPTDASASDGSSFGILFAQHEGEEPTPVRDLYSAFLDPQTARDEPARTWAEDERHAEPQSRLIATEARVLIERAGLDGGDLVAAPVGEHTVCAAIAPMGSGGCGRPYTHGLDIFGEVHGPDLLIFGLVGDKVGRVEVVAAGKTCNARRGRNGFACVFRGVEGDSLERIVLQLSDGTTETIELGR